MKILKPTYCIAKPTYIFLIIYCSQIQAAAINEYIQAGAAIRERYDYAPDKGINKFSLDTIKPYINFSTAHWSGSIAYRFYGHAYPYDYTPGYGDISFPEWAWVGYRTDDDHRLQLGLNQVPFGILPYFSSSVNETLGYLMGIEDLYELGAKYQVRSGPWDIQAGLYGRPAWQGKGTSRAGRTYSMVPAAPDASVAEGSGHKERNLLALRVTHQYQRFDWHGEVGGSLMHSRLRNNDSGHDGQRNLAGAHLTATQGRWSLGALMAYQRLLPRSPGDTRFVTFGGYDSSLNVASKGWFFSTDANYDLDLKLFGGRLHSPRLYSNYSGYLKNGGYKTSQRLICGLAFRVGDYWRIQSEWLVGRHDPSVGAGNYAQALAFGGDGQWHGQFLTNIGFYF